jgi:hypothetical protein
MIKVYSGGNLGGGAIAPPPLRRGRGSISKVEGHWPKGALLYMTKIKRFYVVHEPKENF